MLRGKEARSVEIWPGVRRRTLARSERMLLVEILLSKGARVPAHTHPNDQVGYVAKGRFRMRIGGRDHELSAGDAYAVPANVDHEVEVHEDSVAIDVFSPPREDYGRDLQDR